MLVLDSGDAVCLERPAGGDSDALNRLRNGEGARRRMAAVGPLARRLDRADQRLELRVIGEGPLLTEGVYEIGGVAK